MKLIIASNNKHKIKEIKKILAGKFSEILSLGEADIDHDTVEDGVTFMENARKKAREIAEISGCAALADDSGICVDFLGGEPGIYSARYSGGHGNDEDNNALVLKRLGDTDLRGAHYTCDVAMLPRRQTRRGRGIPLRTHNQKSERRGWLWLRPALRPRWREPYSRSND